MVTNVSCVHASIRESFLPVICIKTDNLNNKTTMVQGRCMQRAHKKENDIRFQGPKKEHLVGKCLSSMPSSFWVLYLLTCVISSYGKIAGLMVLWKLYVKGEGFLRTSLARTSLDINNVLKNLLKARMIAIKPLIDASPKIENRAAVKEVKHK